MKIYIYQILTLVSSIGILLGIWGTLNVIGGYSGNSSNNNAKYEDFVDGAIAGFYKTYTIGNLNIAMSIGSMDLEAKEAAKEQLQMEGGYRLNIFGRLVGNMIFILGFISILFVMRRFKKTSLHIENGITGNDEKNKLIKEENITVQPLTHSQKVALRVGTYGILITTISCVIYILFK